MVEVNYSKSSLRPRLTPQQWRHLSPDARNTWNSLDTDAKNIILGQDKSRQQQVNVAQSGNSNNITENGETTTTIEEEFHDSVTDIPANSSLSDDNTILANFTQRKDLPPGHLQRLLSTPSTYDKHKQQSSNPSSKPKEIVLDGKRYRQINMSKTLYHHSHVTSKGELW